MNKARQHFADLDICLADLLELLGGNVIAMMSGDEMTSNGVGRSPGDQQVRREIAIGRLCESFGDVGANRVGRGGKLAAQFGVFAQPRMFQECRNCEGTDERSLIDL